MSESGAFEQATVLSMEDETHALIPQGPRRPLDAAIAAWLDAKSKRTNSAKTRHAYAETLVQSLDTLDNSTSLCERISGRFSPHLTVRGG